METINHNLKSTLDTIECSIEDRAIVEALLYKEHIHRNEVWSDKEALPIYKDILSGK